MSKTKKRGFEKLNGVVVKSFDQSAINCVYLKTEDGRHFEISADDFHHGAPILKCKEIVKEAK
jgi:hypothetical protein